MSDFEKHLNEFISGVLEKDILTKKSLIKKEINNLIDKIYNNHTSDIDSNTFDLYQKVKEKYLGRGNSWIKINKQDLLWEKIENALEYSNHVNANQYLDLFEELGFGWCRHYKTNYEGSVFEIRVDGPLNFSKVKINLTLKESLTTEFLGGTPISSKLESSEGFGKLIELPKKEIIGDVFVDSIFDVKS